MERDIRFNRVTRTHSNAAKNGVTFYLLKEFKEVVQSTPPLNRKCRSSPAARARNTGMQCRHDTTTSNFRPIEPDTPFSPVQRGKTHHHGIYYRTSAATGHIRCFRASECASDVQDAKSQRRTIFACHAKS